MPQLPAINGGHTGVLSQKPNPVLHIAAVQHPKHA